jgi:predicted nucleic acid-binding protein
VILVDTSVWIDVLRDKSGSTRELLEERIGHDFYVLTRFNQLELLQGAKDQAEWAKLFSYLEKQLYLEVEDRTWTKAARIYFELRRAGRTVRSTIDCCIAELALEHDALLLHRDEDFRTIAGFRPLKQEALT